MPRWPSVERAIAAGMVCLAPEVYAERAPVPEALDYRAPAECPSAAAFSAQVAARTARWGRVPPGLAVRVHVERIDSGLRGVLVLDDESGSTVREVRGERCDDIAQALALIVAILVDPDADTRPLPIPAARSSGPTSAAGSEPHPPRTREEPATRWVFGVGTQLAVTTGLAEGLVVGERWFAALERMRNDRPSLALRLAGGLDSSGTIEHGERLSSTLSRTLLRFDACGAAASSPELAFSACGFAEAGRLDALGRHPLRSETKTVGWVALGALLRAGMRYEGVLGLEAELAAGLPLTRYRFWFDDRALYETSTLVFGAALGLSMHFP